MCIYTASQRRDTLPLLIKHFKFHCQDRLFYKREQAIEEIRIIIIGLKKLYEISVKNVSRIQESSLKVFQIHNYNINIKYIICY